MNLLHVFYLKIGIFVFKDVTIEDDIFPDGLQPHEFFAMSKQHKAKAVKHKTTQKTKYSGGKSSKKKPEKKTILNKILTVLTTTIDQLEQDTHSADYH